MKRLHFALRVAVFLPAMLPLAGCGSGTTQQDIRVSVSPATASLTPGATQQFTATVTGTSSTAVTWSCTGSGCGTIAATGLYTAPASIPNAATVTVVAMLQSDATKSASATVNHAPLLAAGDYVFLFNGWEHAAFLPGRQVIVGRFHADGTGNITNGIEDINTASGVSLSVPFTGTYTLGSDRRGTFTVTTTSGPASYAVVTDVTGTKASFIRFDSPVPAAPVSGSGYFEAQDATAISQASIAGPYALKLASKPYDTWEMDAIGRVTIDSAGGFGGGMMDIGGSVITSPITDVTGSLGAPAPGSGRGTAVLKISPQLGPFSGNLNLVYYVVSANKLIVLQTDTRSDTVADFSGEFQRQTGTFANSSFNVPVIFRAESMDNAEQSAAIGRISPDGNGMLSLIRDQNLGSTVSLNAAFVGTYAVESSGRSTMTLGDTYAIAYMFGPNQGYLLYSGMLGSFKPQASGPFSRASIASTFRHSGPAAVSMFAECDVGKTSFDAAGALTGMQDYTFFAYDGSGYAYIARSQNLSGSYTLDTNGRGVISLVGYDGLPLVFWVVSPDEIITLSTASTQDSLPVLLQYVK